MAPQTETERLQTAWYALAGKGEGDGWRTIQIELSGPCRLLAGRFFPGNEEAILIGFEAARVMPDFDLPEGHGFRVARLGAGVLGNRHLWLALSRRAGASLELFAMMSGDVVGLLESGAADDEQGMLNLFLSRIRAWQDFMQRDRDPVLGPEAEIGLIGELVILKHLINSGIASFGALEAWEGPRGGLHDFRLGSGAIEVKATVTHHEFPATIGSLDQLDPSIRQPLFLAAVRLTLESSGKSLPGLVSEIIELLAASLPAVALFESRLLQAGFVMAMASRYLRRFVEGHAYVLPVDSNFPSLTRHNVADEVTAARYELDVAGRCGEDIGIRAALQQLGVG